MPPPALDTPPAADDATAVTAAAATLPSEPRLAVVDRPTLWPQLALSALSALLLAAAAEPVGQFYLAWIALVPLLLALRGATAGRAALVGFVGGIVHFSALLHWIWHATFVASALLVIWLSLYWATFAGITVGWAQPTRTSTWAAPTLRVIWIACAWTALEWLRSWLLWGGFPFGMTSHTQIALATMCQVADLGGEFAVTFWVAAINALVFLAIAHRGQPKNLLVPAVLVVAIVACAFVYGRYRLSETQTAVSDGPRVMVVQSNFPHQRGGAKTVTFEEQIKFHFDTTERALPNNPHVDLVVWSETVLPAMNPEAVRRSNNPEHSTKLHQRLLDFTREHGVSLVFGAYALLKFDKDDADVRTSAYFYSPAAEDQPRYDKVHLVPFGEAVPFKHSIPWLHRLLFRAAAYSVNYVITPGSDDALTVFSLPGGGRFVTPICFEDMDGTLLRKMLAPDDAGRKRADFIVNITNDGWFAAAQKKQHLAGAAFRSIENRMWSARSCNTGISGFVDSAGRWTDGSTIAPDTAGVKTIAIGIDRRVTPYARVGNLFSHACSAIALAGFVFSLTRRGA